MTYYEFLKASEKIQKLTEINGIFQKVINKEFSEMESIPYQKEFIKLRNEIESNLFDYVTTFSNIHTILSNTYMNYLHMQRIICQIEKQLFNECEKD